MVLNGYIEARNLYSWVQNSNCFDFTKELSMLSSLAPFIEFWKKKITKRNIQN